MFDSEKKIKTVLAEDFINEMEQEYSNGIEEIAKTKDAVSKKLKFLNEKSESITNDYEDYEIDLDAGTAWFNTKDYNFDWKIFEIEA